MKDLFVYIFVYMCIFKISIKAQFQRWRHTKKKGILKDISKNNLPGLYRRAFTSEVILIFPIVLLDRRVQIHSLVKSYLGTQK